MPKSKRDKKISLTKTSKKGLALKQHVVEDIRSCVNDYQRVVLFSVENMRNSKLKDVRSEWKDSRFFFGKNKVMALALGTTQENEVAEGSHKLAAAVRGQCGLLFTNRTKKEVLDWMKNFEEIDYARSGFIATETIVLNQGPMPDFAHSIEPHLRQLGMPTALQKGVVTLVSDYRVCKEGEPLTPEQARIIKLLNKQLALFKLVPLGVYTKKQGFKSLESKKKQPAQAMETDDLET